MQRMLLTTNHAVVRQAQRNLSAQDIDFVVTHGLSGARDAAIIAVLRGTGLRRSEVAALDVADYEAQTSAIVVRSGKGNKDRRVYAPAGTSAALDAWLEVRGHTAGALFGRAVRGGRVGERRLADEGVAVILHDRAAAAGVAPFTPYDMRRTYISELLDAGADLATIQKMVGHESVRRQLAMTGAEMQPSEKLPISCMCRSSRGRPESGYRFDSRQCILPKTSRIGSGHHAGKNARLWSLSKARSFIVRPHVWLQPY
jgi:integrase